MEVRWFGADWDSEKCVVAFEKDGRPHCHHVKRNPAAVMKFLAKFGAVKACVGIEAGDRFWPRLWRAAGAEVVVFDGKKTKRFSQSLRSSGASDDKSAAKALLAMVQSESHRAEANKEAAGEVATLQRLLGLADMASKEVTRWENRLRCALKQDHPALAQAIDGSLQAAWCIRALEVAPTPAAWKELDEGAHEAALKGSSKKSRPALRQAFGEDWNAIDSEEEEAARLHLRHLASALGAALQGHKLVKKRLEKVVKESSVASTIGGVVGLGPYLGSAVAIALLPASSERDAMAIQLGAAPVTRRSGTTGDKHPHVHMRRAVPSPMKKAGHLIGLQLVRNYAWARAQYKFCVERGMKAAAACRRVTRSFLRILRALHRDGARFDEAKYITTLKLKGVPWAKALNVQGLTPGTPNEDMRALIAAAPN